MLRLASILLLATCAVLPARAQNYLFTTVAGSGVHGSIDGTGAAAQLSATAITCDRSGTVYFADSSHTIRKLTADGTVTTIAGVAGQAGYADGTGTAALFNTPVAITADAAGNVYVGEEQNHTIRKLTSAGVVSTLAGQPGIAGSADGTGSAAPSPFGRLRALSEVERPPALRQPNHAIAKGRVDRAYLAGSRNYALFAIEGLENSFRWARPKPENDRRTQMNTDSESPVICVYL